ncbi:hypothetical protein ACFFX0_32760 [Citricoccus parietis]|uniref:Uncharacterized protein n=1 Tax=Citricoccus parietis TaxID=592307 RepID=A0ABV5G9X2_9MICC
MVCGRGIGVGAGSVLGGGATAFGRAELVQLGLGPAFTFGIFESFAFGRLRVLEGLLSVDAGLNGGGDVLDCGEALVVEFAGLVDEGFGDVLGHGFHPRPGAGFSLRWCR